MASVILDITVSLDGIVAGPNVDLDLPMGEGGERLHRWLAESGSGSDTAVDSAIANEMFASTGAFVMGRRTFDVGEEPWGEDGTFGVPCFVVTHRPHEPLVRGPTTFSFVTDGVESAVRQAKAAARDLDVVVMGGAYVAQQCLRAGLLDEMRLHLAPVMLGTGSRLFGEIGVDRIEWECTRVIESLLATHLTFRLVRQYVRAKAG